MKTNVTRKAVIRPEHRMPTRPTPTPLRVVQSELAWPGFTRAELREHIIEMIG